MKKLLSFLLSVMLILSVVPMGLFSITASAVTSTSGTTGDCTWKLDGTVLTISGDGKMGNYGGSKPPWSTSYITAVIIKYGVTSIGVSAFLDCKWLTSITIPNSVTSIGKHAFLSCWRLTSVTIPASVTSIDGYVFRDCKGLTSITIPNSVKSIGEFAFYGCTGLTSVIIPNGVKIIGKSSFSGCTGLTSITIPDSVTSIGESSFSGCTGLTSITMPDSVTSIGESSFSGCTGLTSINIPNGVTSIGNSAFYRCSGLTSVTIPASVTSIDEYVFRYCTGLTSVTIPNSVKSIGEFAFFGCNSLTSVYYGGSFASRKKISIDTGNDNLNKAEWHYADIKDVLTYVMYGKETSDGNILWSVYVKDCAPWVTEVEIPETVTITGITYKVTGILSNSLFGGKGFSGCNKLTSITMPNSIERIGAYAFSDCTALTSITIPDRISIDGNAFKNCAIKKIIISDGSETVTSNMIVCKSTLESITMPNSVTSISDSAFLGCTRLTSITIPDSVTNIGKHAFLSCSRLTSIKIPDSITSIDEYVFKNCTGLTSITIPDSVTSIGKYAFEGCTGLTSIIIPDSVTSIGSNAFSGCTGLTSIKIPDSITSIDEYVFKNCTGLTSITIPGSITSIDKYAFSGCENIDTVYYGGTETQWSKLSNKPNCKNVVYCNKIGIKVTKLPSKINYTEGENLSLYGGEVSVLYNNDIYDKSTALNSLTVKVTGFDTTKPSKQTLTVEYLGYTTAFDVNVIEKPENKTEFAGGKGVEHNPYLVSDKTQLNNVRKYPDAYFKQTKDIEFTAADFATGGMFYNNGYGWMPIGKDTNSSFNGCYDGGGYSIKNLRISITTNNSAYGGLFGYNTGKLKNITVENGNITVKAEKNSYAGAIVGYVRYGNIENCHNKNTFVKANVAGGIAGCVNFTEKIENCSNSGSLECTFTVGGIVGGLTTSSGTLISNCTNSGNLVLPYNSGTCVGGIVGHHENGPLKVEDCKNFGRIYAENTALASLYSGATFVGGMIGYTNNSTVKGCINKADIYGYAAGGIVGYGITYITNCINEGNISGSSVVGGIVGSHYYGTIHDCTNKGKITGVEYRENKKVSDYSGSAGGIVGSVKQHNEIQRCRNIGNVYNGYYSGGIAGIGGSIWYCYNTGNVVSQEYSGGISADFKESDYTKKISYCYNTGNIRGKNAAGIIASIGEGTVSNCYTVGRIEKISDEGYIGAIAAYMTGGIIEECYYLNNISSGTGYVDYSVSNEPQTTKLTDKQMQNAESFTDFNFTNIWTMDGNNDYLYPELKDVEMIYIPYTPGDLDGDEKITDKDAIYLLMHSYFPDDYPVNQPLDYNNDGLINDKDAIYLLMHCYFPEDYPITK